MSTHLKSWIALLHPLICLNTNVEDKNKKISRRKSMTHIALVYSEHDIYPQQTQFCPFLGVKWYVSKREGKKTPISFNYSIFIQLECFMNYRNGVCKHYHHYNNSGSMSLWLSNSFPHIHSLTHLIHPFFQSFFCAFIHPFIHHIHAYIHVLIYPSINFTYSSCVCTLCKVLCNVLARN
jgi:hypothetical protein